MRGGYLVLSLAVTAGILVAATASHAQQAAPVTTATAPSPTCYEEIAIVSTRAREEEDKYGIPLSWHQQLNTFLASDRQDPATYPADILALPDLHGMNDIPNLHAVIAHDRDMNAGTLFRDLSAFQKRDLDALFTGDTKTMDDVRDILFRWFGVQDIGPHSRGPFIDARQLAFLERVMGETFLQLGKYPNPAPIAAGELDRAFNAAFDHFYAALLLQGPARQLMDATGAALDAGVLEKLSTRAKGMGLAAQINLWRSVALVVPMERQNTPNRAALQKAISESSPGLTLDKVMNKTPTAVEVFNDQTQAPGHQDQTRYSYYDERPLKFEVIYKHDMSRRHICYLFLDTH